MCRCPSCAGLNDPPNSPTRVIRRSPNRGKGSGTHLAVTADRVAVYRQLLQSDRPAGMDAAGRDADLGAEAKLAAVAELSGRIPECHRAVDTRQETLGGLGVLGDDGVGVRAAMAGDMSQRRIDPI